MQLRFIRYGRVFNIQYASELYKILIGLEFNFLRVFAWHEQSLSRSSAGYYSTFLAESNLGRYHMVFRKYPIFFRLVQEHATDKLDLFIITNSVGLDRLGLE